MSNHVGILALNNYDLTLQVVEDALCQDIPTNVVVWDNGSTDRTCEKLEALRNPRISLVRSDTNIGVGPGWNQLCAMVFGGLLGGSTDHVLICNNDIRLRGDTYRNLLIPNGGFVTPINVGSWEKAKGAKFLVEEEPVMKGGPDFSCFLIKREFYEKVGPFPECYYPAWFEDNEYHWIAKCKGFDSQIYSVTFPYSHLGSQTLKNNHHIQQLNAEMFEKNKELYVRRWGGLPGHESFKEVYDGRP